SYRRVHQWLQMAFEKTAVATALSASAGEKAPEQCFVGAQRSDLLWRGKKIAGAAQRRTRDGLLIQGSIQPPAAIDRIHFEAAMLAVAGRNDEAQWTPLNPDSTLLSQVNELVRQKYSKPDYNRRQ